MHIRARSRNAALAISLSLALPMLPGCGREPGSAQSRPAAEPRTVSLVPVQTRPVDRFIEVTGTLFGQEELTISAEVPGRILTIKRDLGDEVAPGDEIAAIDPTDYALAVEQERAALLAALAKLGLDALPEGEPDLASLPLVARAEAQELNARARLDRARKLYEQDPPLISEQDFADIRTQHEVAATTAGVERLNATALVAEARVRASALRQAEERLRDTRVTAPAEPALRYRVAARRISAGEVVAQGQALFRLVAPDRVKFRAQVPERLAPGVRVGARAELIIDAYPEPFIAAVTRVSPAVDIATRAFEVEIEADNPEGRLKPGGFARARILTGTDSAAVFVPDSAVAEFAGVQRIFSVAEGKAVEHRVRLGPAAAGMREVLDPPAGLTQVIDRPRAIAPGTPVTAEPIASR